jgi:hypothetical protein
MGATWRLYSDHIGAQITEDLSAEKGAFVGEVEDPIGGEHVVS